MVNMFSFVEDLDEAVMRLKMTGKIVKEMLVLIPEVADFAMKLADTNVLKGEHSFLQ